MAAVLATFFTLLFRTQGDESSGQGLGCREYARQVSSQGVISSIRYGISWPRNSLGDAYPLVMVAAVSG